MAQQTSENKKLDFSSLPRGAIGIRGLPVSRNTRLPSIRSPRDLTLGALPKRTFMPNIPVRREKKSSLSSNDQVKQENMKIETKVIPSVSDHGRGRGRGKIIIQTQGSIFSEGVTADAVRKEKRARESRSDYSSSVKGITIKKEVEDKDVAGISAELGNLFRDDFIDDGDADNDCIALKPIIFPPLASVKKETKSEEQEPTVNFDPNIAKEMDFDVNRVAQFIKKEKGSEPEEAKKTVKSPVVLPSEINNLLNIDSESSKLVLLKFPQFPNVTHKGDEAECSQRQFTNLRTKTHENQNLNLSSVKNLPEGHIGKLQILKSGKTRLLIGPVEYTLDSFNSMRNSKHELVSIATNSNTGDLSVLGCVNDVLNFVPNDARLLGQC